MVNDVHIAKEERTGCFTLLLLCCGCLCSLSLPQGAVGLCCVIVAFPGHTHLFFILFSTPQDRTKV